MALLPQEVESHFPALDYGPASVTYLCYIKCSTSDTSVAEFLPGSLLGHLSLEPWATIKETGHREASILERRHRGTYAQVAPYIPATVSWVFPAQIPDAWWGPEKILKVQPKAEWGRNSPSPSPAHRAVSWESYILLLFEDTEYWGGEFLPSWKRRGGG